MGICTTNVHIATMLKPHRYQVLYAKIPWKNNKCLPILLHLVWNMSWTKKNLLPDLYLQVTILNGPGYQFLPHGACKNYKKTLPFHETDIGDVQHMWIFDFCMGLIFDRRCTTHKQKQRGGRNWLTFCVFMTPFPLASPPPLFRMPFLLAIALQPAWEKTMLLVLLTKNVAKKK